MLSSKNNNVYSFRDNSPIFDELFSEDKRQKKQAQDDVHNAIKEFRTESDIRRQHIYMTQIHTEGHQYDEALKILFGDYDIKQWLKNVKNNPFEIYAYVRLMAEGKSHGWEMADKMYNELNKTQIISDLKSGQNFEHPFEVIFWKLGSYYAHCGKSQKAALDSFAEALKCYSSDDRLTVNVICFTIELERYAFVLKENLSEKNKYQKQLKKHFTMFKNENIPDSIYELYKDIKFEEKDWNYFYKLSRRITY